ncbi:MAG: sensor histidine kinase [Acutalibacteraceae bacterium]
MRLLGEFLKEQCGNIVLFMLFAGIFFGVFYVYHIENEAFFYALLICSVIGSAVEIIRFIFFIQRHKRLRIAYKNVELLSEQLPEPCGLIEQDYQEIGKKMCRMYHEACRLEEKHQRESIDYYTAWVHQIKTPMAAMRLYLQSEDTEQNALLLSELFQIEQYVEMVLCYFRVDSTSNDFVFQEYALDDIIRQAIRKYAAQFVQKKLKLIYKGTAMRVVTDEKGLLFVIEQLLSNAIKYTNKGSITIEAENGILKIIDTGIGMAPEDLPRIFEKGFTGYNGRLDKKSTGLGLYLCKRITDKLSCELSVQSEIKKGTTVQIIMRDT